MSNNNTRTKTRTLEELQAMRAFAGRELDTAKNLITQAFYSIALQAYCWAECDGVGEANAAGVVSDLLREVDRRAEVLRQERDEALEAVKKLQVTLANTPQKTTSRIERAVVVAEQYAGIDGAQHKQWAIDQMLRHMLGEKYDFWVEVYNSPEAYENWDTGIAP